jgi:hypothetical protein
LKIGDRVVNILRGEVGIVETVDGEFVDYRCLTPKNEPSCCLTMTMKENLVVVGDNVLPQPRSKEWFRESAEFCAGLTRIIKIELAKPK